MRYDNDKQFFHAVQQEETVAKYGEIWAKVLWLGCMAVKQPQPSMGMILTNEQTESATPLLHMIANTAHMGAERSSLGGLILLAFVAF
ncbi:hypothetical protein V1508DRAFT_26945 [Lipomyces doorenjongii]|uniref:uncharacterized protein n=1 Tax=Lipomyces doorenjongii TaxID=383834 RepID=UPI0034CD5B4F